MAWTKINTDPQAPEITLQPLSLFGTVTGDVSRVDRPQAMGEPFIGGEADATTWSKLSAQTENWNIVSATEISNWTKLSGV